VRQAVFFGQGELADQILPPGWFGHVEDGPRYAYDPDRARALLAEAGHPNGFRTTLVTWAEPRPYMPSPRDAAALIKSDLARVGIDVDIQTMTWNAYLAERGRGNFGMALGGYISSTLDPDGLVFPLFHSSFIRLTDSLNWARWRNAEADELLQRAGAMYEEGERTRLYERVSRIIMEESPVVFFNYPPNAIVARREVQGLFIHPSVWVPVDHLTIQR
jgi:ABC-type transport system substrate-binding protein